MKKKTILLIEDDRPIVDVYTTALEETGLFKVETLIYGYQAMDWIKDVKRKKAKKPDLILLDLILPDINGIDILKELKKQKETKDIPVFILTNYSGKQMEKEGKSLKVEKYLNKTDFSLPELVKIVKEKLVK